jgi:hypothetical protein
VLTLAVLVAPDVEDVDEAKEVEETEDIVDVELAASLGTVSLYMSPSF